MKRLDCIFILFFLIHVNLIRTQTNNSALNPIDDEKKLAKHIDKPFNELLLEKNTRFLRDLTREDNTKIFDNIIKYCNNHQMCKNTTEDIKNLKNTIQLIDRFYEKFIVNINDSSVSANETVYELKFFFTNIPKIGQLLLILMMENYHHIYQRIFGRFNNLPEEECNGRQAMQWYILKLFDAIEIVILRYMVLSTILRMSTTEELLFENFDFAVTNITNEHAIIERGYWQTVKELLSQIPREICIGNPQHHERNVTFIELERTFQYFIATAKDLGHEQVVTTCRHLRAPQDQNCNGEIDKCKRIGQVYDWKIKYSIAHNSSRRYNWFCGKDDMYGRSLSTTQQFITISAPKSRVINSFIGDVQMITDLGEVCACLCTAKSTNSRSIQTISLLSQESDIQSNMVVTGVKFELADGMIHIKIKEGKLMPFGLISADSEAWKPYEDISHHTDGEFYRIIDGVRFRLNRFSDFVRIGDHSRIIGLSDVTVPKNHVVTGVRFAYEKETVNYEDFWPLSLEVKSTPFDIITGQLALDNVDFEDNWIKSDWPNVDELESGNYETLFKNNLVTPDDPLVSPTNTVYPHERYAVFSESDLKKDAGQSTVPFFDAQPVEVDMDEKFALSGIGLTRKGPKNGGGFLALKIFTIDYSQYITIDDA